MTKIERQVAAIGEIARKRGGWINVRVRARAQESAISACEESVSLAFPPLLKSFLRKHDGLIIRVYSAKFEGQWFEEAYFEIRGVTDIAVHTRQFREYRAAIQAVAPESLPQDLGSEYIDALDFADPDRRYLIAEQGHAVTEPPVVEINLYTWPVETADVIAASFAEFVERAFSFMLETEGGFTFWHPPTTDW